MSAISPYSYKVITEGTPDVNWGIIDPFNNIDWYYIYGDADITEDWIISVDPQITPVEGTVLTFFYDGTNIVSTTGKSLTFFGTVLTPAQLSKSNIIYCTYTSNGWFTFLVENYAVVNGQPFTGILGTDEWVIDGTGDDITLNPLIDKKYLIISGSGVLSGDYYFSSTGVNTIVDGDEFWIKYEATFTGNYIIDIYGIQLSQAQRASGDCIIYTKYSTEDNTWHSILLGSGGTTTSSTDDTSIYIDTNGKISSKLWESNGYTNSIQAKNDNTAHSNAASAQRAFSLGKLTTAVGDSSMSMGMTATGVARLVKAQGIASFAGGYVQGSAPNTMINSYGIGSFAFGISFAGYHKATGNGSAVFGQDNQAGANYSFVTGNNNTTDIYSIYSAIIGGNNNSVGNGSANYNGTILGGSGNLNTSENSSIIGGTNNINEHSGAIILGGTGITSRADNTTYVQELSFKDTSAINLTSATDTPTPATPRAGMLLDEVGVYTIKLDDLATPDDNTDLDATSTHHGLLPKLENTGTKVLFDDGTWQVPPGAGGTGEVNTASNLGTGADGEGLYSSKVGVDLKFKRIKGGTNITVTGETNDVKVDCDLDFGVILGTIPEIESTLGNSMIVETNAFGQLITATKNTAYNANFGGNGTATTVAHSDHTHATVSTHASTHLSGSTDEIDGDKLDIDYTPSQYTPAIASPYSDTTSQLASHLNGINTALPVIRANQVDATDTAITISYSSTIGTTSYALIITTYDSNGEFVAYTVTNKTATGFTIATAAPCKVHYIATRHK